MNPQEYKSTVFSKSETPSLYFILSTITDLLSTSLILVHTRIVAAASIERKIFYSFFKYTYVYIYLIEFTKAIYLETMLYQTQLRSSHV